MSEKPIRAAGYVRVSTSHQAKEGLSLDEQQRNVEKYIADQGWEHAGTFVEAGVSGRRDDRPELSRLMALVANLDAVVIPKLDWLGRSTRHLVETVERLEKAGVRLVSLRDHIDTSTPSGRASAAHARVGGRVRVGHDRRAGRVREHRQSAAGPSSRPRSVRLPVGRRGF